MLKRRSWLERLARFPWFWYQHYRILRKYNGRLDAARAGTRLAALILVP